MAAQSHQLAPSLRARKQNISDYDHQANISDIRRGKVATDFDQ